jgi:hypothetical protein
LRPTVEDEHASTAGLRHILDAVRVDDANAPNQLEQTPHSNQAAFDVSPQVELIAYQHPNVAPELQVVADQRANIALKLEVIADQHAKVALKLQRIADQRANVALKLERIADCCSSEKMSGCGNEGLECPAHVTLPDESTSSP